MRGERARAVAKYRRDVAKLGRLLAAGDADAALALIDSEAFFRAGFAVWTGEVVAAAKEAEDTWPHGDTLFHALHGHARAVGADKLASMRAEIMQAQIDALQRRLAALERKENDREL